MVQAMLLLLLFSVVLTVKSKSLNFPTANTAYNRILGLICSYNMDHIDSLYLILQEYVSMCEGGFDPNVVIFTTSDYTPQARRLIKYRTWCYRSNSSIKIEYNVHDPSISINLASLHRKYMGSQVNNFDLFIYHEDDMMVKYAQVVAFLIEIKKLQTLLPDSALRDNTFGFLRYRRLGGSHGYQSKDMIEQELMDEEPTLHHICIGKEPYLHVTGNMHQAMWLFTQEHVHILQDKCQFLNQTQASREFMSSFSIFDKKPHHCGLNKLLPGLTFHTFFIQHYYQSKQPHWHPIFKATDNALAGRHYMNDQGEPHVPDCWKDVVRENRAIQFIPSAAPSAAATAAVNASARALRTVLDVDNNY